MSRERPTPSTSYIVLAIHKDGHILTYGPFATGLEADKWTNEELSPKLPLGYRFRTQYLSRPEER